MWSRFVFVLALACVARGITRDQLYSHGLGLDLQLPRGHEVASPEITLKVPVVFYGETYPTIYVNNHGVLSFRTDIATFLNAEFPLAYPSIAAFYSNVDTTAAGTVYYRETQDGHALVKGAETVQNNFPEYYDFRPLSIFIATWNNVGYNREGVDKLNAFQAAIISNGTESFVEFLFPEDGIQWIQGNPHVSGLPDARAQSGFVAEDGRYFTLRGSGSHQIRNIISWTNTQEPGRYIFRVGRISPEGNVAVPDQYDANEADYEEDSKTCAQSTPSVCHMQARCVDYQSGICCQCIEGFYGNGKSCIKNDVPLRVSGKLFGEINGIMLDDIDIQSYVVVADGRTYTAVSSMPETIGYSFQTLNILGGVVGWLFAKPLGSALNGYQLTGAVFNHTAEITFTTTGDRVTIRQQFVGHDVFDQINLETDVRGTLPALAPGSRLEINEYEEQYTLTDVGVIRSDSRRVFKNKINGVEYEQRVTQTFNFRPCLHAPVDDADRVPVTLKVAKNFLGYEGREGIVRYGMSNKIVPLGQEDPCIKGRETCGRHSSCVVDGDGYNCICNSGYQSLYQENDRATCVDVNECSAGTHNCDYNAQCYNNEGGFQCACNSGYEGDGISCAKISGCRSTVCDPNAQCQEGYSGDANCVCNEGFNGDGQRCWPAPTPSPAQLKSCDTLHNCSPYASCLIPENTSTYVCQCYPGYTGDGYTCTELAPLTTTTEPNRYADSVIKATCIFGFCSCSSDYTDKFNAENGTVLCRKPQPEPLSTTTEDNTGFACTTEEQCPYNAECAYNQATSAYECRCLEGFVGDGHNAECIQVPVPGCEYCDRHANCISTYEGVGECVCGYGFSGDGTICHPKFDCLNDTDCEANAECLLNQYTNRNECQCLSGYTKDQNDACVPEGRTCNSAKCAEHSTCQWDNDVQINYCQCDPGYDGEGTERCVLRRTTCDVAHNCHENAVCAKDEYTLDYNCICRDGYTGDGYTCTLIPTCQNDPYMCDSHASCVRQVDGFKCECNSGYNGDGSTCTPNPKQDGNFILLATGTFLLRVPFAPSYRDVVRPIQNSNAQTAVGLDVDCQTGRVYWGDVTGRVINTAYFDGTGLETFANDNSPEGLSVDWVSRNIYWTDSKKLTIEVANLDTKIRKVLFSDGLTNPRGIAVHPRRGKIFWSDWNRTGPKIEWANMDGSDRSVFIAGYDVLLPNSLSIDWTTDSLCYADAGLKKIECVQIDTLQKERIASNCSYPFGLANTDENFYWTDWKTKKIEYVNRRTQLRGSIPVSSSGSKMFGMAVAPDQCLPVSNICQNQNGNCPPGYLCLLNGQGGRSCVCGISESGMSVC